MTNSLFACPGCMRHIRAAEVLCPFCGAGVPPSLREQKSPPSPAGRLSRAAMYALRAGALSMTAAACGGATAAISAAEGDGGNTDSATMGGVALYGGSPPDLDSGGMTDAAYGGTGIALYGSPFVEDAGGRPDASGDADAGEGAADAKADAPADAGSVVAPYGSPPIGVREGDPRAFR